MEYNSQIFVTLKYNGIPYQNRVALNINKSEDINKVAQDFAKEEQEMRYAKDMEFEYEIYLTYK